VVPDAVTARATLDEIGLALAAQPDGGLVRNVRLFDEYRGKGLENKEKSLAFRFWLQDTQRTLNDAEVARLLDAVVARLAERLGARLRASA
jgi:phenylalanyl-tRNA synthetase beta chain